MQQDVSNTRDAEESEPGSAGPRPLEVRYRRLLRVLPAGYRAVREQEMVDTFLASECAADPDNACLTLRLGWPGVREAAGVLALAVQVRWVGAAAPERARVRARALHIAVLAALTVFAVLAVWNLLNRIWLAAARPEYGSAAFPGVASVDALGSTLQNWSFLLWAVALVSVLSGRPRSAQLAGAVPMLTTLVATGFSLWWAGSWPMIVYSVALVLVQAAVLIGLFGFDARVPVAGRRGWVIAAAVAVLALSAVTVAAWSFPAARDPLALVWVDDAGIWCAAAVIAALMLLVRRARGSQVSTEALLGIAVLAVAAGVLRAGTFAEWALTLPSDSWPTATILTATALQLLAAAAVVMVAGTLGARRFRRLPPVRYSIAT